LDERNSFGTDIITAGMNSRCVILGALLLAGCVRFQPQPLSPAQTADQLESRSLTNAHLRAFLETNAHRALPDLATVDWDLDLLTLAAFYYHPSLEVARADWQLAVGGIKTAAERPNPTVTASGVYEPAADAFSPWIPGLIFDLPIETAGKRRLRGEHARHLTDAARFNVATAAWQVRSRLRLALIDFIAARERFALLQHQAELREDLANRLNRQFEAGAISAAEVNTIRMALIRARADLADAQRLMAEALPRLASAVGVSAAAVEAARIHFDLTALGPVEGLTTPEARRMALLGRADILAALAEYSASQSALQLEIAKQYPDVHLSTGYSWNAGSTGEHDGQLGLNIELPVLNQHEGPIAEAAARRNASAARFLALQAKVIGNMEGAVASFQAGQKNVVSLDALVTAQRAQRGMIAAQFQAGAVDRLEVLTTELELSANEAARLDAQVKLQQALSGLEDAVQRPFSLPGAIFVYSGRDDLK
jgi:outer membrane protein, heavy metal efflux system